MNGEAPPASTTTSNIDLYEILGVDRKATKAEIKKAYHKAALASHPDKVAEIDRANAEIRFKALSQAYEILFDEEKRALYDEHGMAAFDGSRGGPGGMGPDLDDILNMFGMGGGIPGFGGAGGPRRPRRSPNEEQKYEVALEDFYKGKTVKFESTKNVICSLCEGTGGKKDAKAKECTTCKGQGFRQVLRQVGPMLTQETIECSVCGGAGSVYNPKDKCKKCKGKRTTEETKQLEIYIPRGAREGERIVLEGEADQVPGTSEPGDIVFHLTEIPHDVFTRTGADLSAKLDITLAEALIGFHRVVLKHLDGRGIELHHPNEEGKILRPGQVLRVKGEGMPFKKSDAKGDLYLAVDVEFPEDGFFQDAAAVEQLQKLLPGPEPPIVAEVVDEVQYDDDADIEDLGHGEDEGAWEDEAGGPQQAQCATQ